MFLSIILWAIKAVTLLLLDVVTWVLSPILCLFVTKAEEQEVTGFPSMYPGKPREFLIKPLRMFQSFDAPLDEWWYADYQMDSYLKRNYTQQDYERKWWLRYVCRILWLCRNPAYGFGLAMGYNTDNVTYLVERDNNHNWNKPVSHTSFWKCVDEKGRIGWWWKGQWFYTKTRCVKWSLGYKLDADSPNGNKVVAMQFHPVRFIE